MKLKKHYFTSKKILSPYMINEFCFLLFFVIKQEKHTLK